MNNSNFKKYLVIAICVVIIGLVLLPIVNVLLLSFMSDQQSLTQTVIPSPFSLDGYKQLQSAGLMMPFIRTIIISLIGTLISVVLIVFASFSISRDEFKYKKIVFAFLYVQMVIPASALIVSRFGLMKELGLLNTYSALIISALCSYSSIFIMQSYIKKVPESLIEMVFVNGGTMKDAIKDVIIPIVKPGIVFISLLSFIGYYNMYLEPILFITDPNKKTLQVAVRDLLGAPGDTSTQIILPNLQNAAVILTLSIIIIIIPLLNKYYIKGATDGGVK